jgi:toluene monooxygenase system ferredoxin subunit
MAYQTLCKKTLLSPSELVPAMVGKTEVVIMWPEGGRPRAFNARCPHEGVSLAQGIFNGSTLICPAHGWVFDGHTGEGLSPTGCEMLEYPIQINGEMIEIDLDEDSADED